jgi:hypothetical protein
MIDCCLWISAFRAAQQQQTVENPNFSDEVFYRNHQHEAERRSGAGNERRTSTHESTLYILKWSVVFKVVLFEFVAECWRIWMQ